MNPPPPSSPNSKWEALALLWFAFCLNLADWQIFGVVRPLIRADLHLSDAKLGFMAPALGWTLAFTVPLAGWVSDRYPKNWVMIMFAFLTGACSPCLLGVLKPTLGLAHGLASLGAVYLVGALAIALAWRGFVARDRVSTSCIL